MNTFKDLNLSPELTTAIEALGYTAPTPIQAETLPLLLEGPTDFIGLAATGTGKTAAFGIPLLEQIDAELRETQGLILCPTRELAIQVTEQLNLLGKNKNIRAVPIYGGAGYGDQIRGVKSGAQIVVATPGRLIDHLDRGTVKLNSVQTIILDEADEMISMGFKEDLEAILEKIPNQKCNKWMFSATMSKDVRKVANRFLIDPKIVEANKSEMLSGTVQQIYYKSKESDKLDILCKLIDAADEFYGLIFCQTKSLVVDLTTALHGRGYKVDCLHGDKTQGQREHTMRAFKERRVSVVVCTDVASRGIDVKDLTHVINYSIPRELDNYVHRIGRTGRSGKAGLALSLVTASHMGLIGRIEKLTGSKIQLGTIPTRKDIGEKKVAKLFEQFQAVTNQNRAEELLSDEWKTTLESMTKSEIASRLLVLSFPDVFVDARQKEKAEMPGAAMRTDGGDRAPRDYGQRESRYRGGERGDRGGSFSRGPRAGFGGGGERRDFRKDRDDRGAGGGFDAPRERSPRPSFSDRPEGRSFGDRPEGRSFGDRPARPSFGDRPERKSFGDRPERRSFSDRPAFGDRPEGRSFGDRPARPSFGDRPPRKSFGDHDGGRPSFKRERPDGDRPWTKSAPRGEGRDAGAERSSQDPFKKLFGGSEKPKRDSKPRTRAW